MYFWKTEKLESDFINGSLSQRDRYKYLLAFIIIIALGMELSIYIPEPPSIISFLQSSFAILITIIGAMFYYRVNKQGDNADFIYRYICLFLPVFIRLVVFYIIILSLYMILEIVFLGYAFEKFIASTNWIDIFFTVGFELILFWKLSVLILKMAMSKTGEEFVT